MAGKVDRQAPSAAQTPELVRIAARAMLNDPDSISGELVRAWKALKAERDRYQRALELIASREYADAAENVAGDVLSRV